jgi:NADPH-dependent 7-cyano-7-deazaguanine reductase QueF-like protein
MPRLLSYNLSWLCSAGKGYFSAGNPSASQILVKTSIALLEKNTCRLHLNTGRNKYALRKTVVKPMLKEKMYLFE